MIPSVSTKNKTTVPSRSVACVVSWAVALRMRGTAAAVAALSASANARWSLGSSGMFSGQENQSLESTVNESFGLCGTCNAAGASGVDETQKTKLVGIESKEAADREVVAGAVELDRKPHLGSVSRKTTDS